MSAPAPRESKFFLVCEIQSSPTTLLRRCSVEIRAHDHCAWSCFASARMRGGDGRGVAYGINGLGLLPGGRVIDLFFDPPPLPPRAPGLYSDQVGAIVKLERNVKDHFPRHACTYACPFKTGTITWPSPSRWRLEGGKEGGRNVTPASEELAFGIRYHLHTAHTSAIFARNANISL